MTTLDELPPLFTGAKTSDDLPGIWAGRSKGTRGAHAKSAWVKSGELLPNNMVPCRTKLGLRLRLLRLAAGYNTPTMARLLHYSSTGTISDHEIGNKIPSLEVLMRYARVHHTTVSEILDGVI